MKLKNKLKQNEIIPIRDLEFKLRLCSPLFYYFFFFGTYGFTYILIKIEN